MSLSMFSLHWRPLRILSLYYYLNLYLLCGYTVHVGHATNQSVYLLSVIRTDEVGECAFKRTHHKKKSKTSSFHWKVKYCE